MREWKEYNVQELIDRGFLQIGDGYRAKNSELSKNGLPFARAGNLTSGFDFSSCDYFPHKDLKKVGEKRSQVGDVAFTSKGTVGRFAFVTEDVPSFVYSPQICFWRSLDADFLDPHFLFYWMNSRGFLSQINSVKGQTDMADYVSLRDQKQMHLLIPKIDIQRQISNLLSTLDAKITLLHRQNRTLEEMAQALFKRWFIDFEFPDAQGRPYRSSGGKMVEGEMGEVPAGWVGDTLGSICEVIDCLHSKKPDQVFEPTGKILLQLNNIKDNGIIDTSEKYFISDEDYELWTSRIEVQKGDCVITNVGRYGAVSQVPSGLKAALGRNMTGIRLKPQYQSIPSFLIVLLLSKEMKKEIEQKKDSGTILDALNVKAIPNLGFKNPGIKKLLDFQNLVHPLREKMEYNLSQIQTLTTLRDTLLPRLMSGELRVGDVS